MNYCDWLDLDGKIAVVTGGAGLIGREVVKGLAEMGAVTILADIKKKDGEKIVRQYKNSNLNVIFRRVNITQEKSVSELIEYINKTFRRLDIWVNCAYPRTSDWARTFDKVSSISWRRNIDMHLNGYMLCSQQCAEYMKTKKGGSIINMASIYGVIGPDFSLYKNTHMTMPAAYSAIKGGIISFTRFLASYYGKYNIRVNSVSAGGVYNKQPDAFVKRYSEKVPLKRMAKPEDIAGAVIFLASDASSYMTGFNLVVDGGLTII